MKVCFLTSYFPNGFTNDFINCIKEYYTNEGSFVLVASDFSTHSKNDKYTDIFLNMFKDNGIIFKEANVVDNRISKATAKEYIEESEVVWLSGGDTLNQIKDIKDYDLIEALQTREKITIGMSAGSINMAKRVVLAKDINDNVPKLSTYDGIGLVDINIEPHLDPTNEEHNKDIYEASKLSTIYGLYDDSFIKIINDEIEIYGDYIKYEKINE